MDLSLGFKIYEDCIAQEQAVLSLEASPPRLPPRGAQCSPPPVMRMLKKKPATGGDYEVLEPMPLTHSIRGYHLLTTPLDRRLLDPQDQRSPCSFPLNRIFLESQEQRSPCSFSLDRRLLGVGEEGVWGLEHTPSAA